MSERTEELRGSLRLRRRQQGGQRVAAQAPGGEHLRVELQQLGAQLKRRAVVRARRATGKHARLQLRIQCRLRKSGGARRRSQRRSLQGGELSIARRRAFCDDAALRSALCSALSRLRPCMPLQRGTGWEAGAWVDGYVTA